MNLKSECVVPFCESKKRKGQDKTIGFHEFPANLKVREEWIKIISRKDQNTNKLWSPPDDWYYVCSLHFKDSDYNIGKCRRLLKREAVPSIFPNYPKYLQKKNKENRKPPKVREPPIKKPKTINYSVEVQGKDEFTEISNIETSKYVSKSVQVHSLKGEKSKSIYKTKIGKKHEVMISRLRKRNQILQDNLKKYKAALKDNTYMKLQEIKKSADKGESKAKILMEQFEIYSKVNPRYSEHFIRLCVLWRSKSPRAYEMARTSKFFTLPSPSTLRKYIGPGVLKCGFTDLIKERLKEEFSQLSSKEINCSLVFDEMAIHPREQYVRQVRRVIGRAQYGKNVKKNMIVIANRLLCFIVKGLSTSYTIPVSYYLVKELEGEELFSLILNIIESVEEIGFHIIRIVGDCGTINVKALTLLANGQLNYKIPHPFSSDRPLFISFDPCHILKNLRNQFIDPKRKMMKKKRSITANPIKKLYELQQNLTIKPVRFLTKKMLYPTSFEKMKVGRAIKLFSDDVISALKLCSESKYSGFEGIEETIIFMELVKKWFEIHNIATRFLHISTRNPNKKQFSDVNDERFDWLEHDFLSYFINWNEEILNDLQDTNKNLIKSVDSKAYKKIKKLEFLTKETFTALKITTLSTIHCIKYLLNEGFGFFLTSKLTSDSIEAFFGALRQSQGSNDQIDAVGVLYSLEKSLKLGLISSSENSNVESGSNIKTIFNSLKKSSKKTTDYQCAFSFKTNQLLDKLKSPEPLVRVNLANSGITMVSGFLVLKIMKTIKCIQAQDNFIDLDKKNSANKLITLKDRGGLRHPNSLFSGFVKLLFEILEDNKEINYEISKPIDFWQKWLIPYFNPNIIGCGCKDTQHTNKIQNLITFYVVKIFLTNSSFTNTQNLNLKPKFTEKNLSKKIKKV